MHRKSSFLDLQKLNNEYQRIDEILVQYNEKKESIHKQLMKFERTGRGLDEILFAELCFCLLTPQSKAKSCDRAIEKLTTNRLLLDGSIKDISKNMKNVRFYNNKARWIVTARETFHSNGKWTLKKLLKEFSDSFTAREWLVDNILGLGYKEASHFLRNIGKGENLAILDRHILKNMQYHGILGKIPKTLTKKEYLKTENLLRNFSKHIGIPLSELDLLFWSRETGEIFK